MRLKASILSVLRLIPIFVATALLLLNGCMLTEEKQGSNIHVNTELYHAQRKIGNILDPKLEEASGLIASVKNPGCFWTHTDSGGEPELYLIDTTGRIHLTVKLEGVKNRDWEDLAMGNGYIYVGDIGDNKAQKKKCFIHRITEPKRDSENQLLISKDSIVTMGFSFENGARDAETLIYDHLKDELVLVTKRDESAYVYSFPFVSGKKNEITPLGQLNLTMFTAGDSNPTGELVLKNYRNIFVWPTDTTRSVADRILQIAPKRIHYSEEPQGEAIALDAKGNLYTTSEKVSGLPQAIFKFVKY